MKISYNWLKQYLDLDIAPDKVAELLTGCGLEVESMEPFQSVKGGLKGVVIAEVLTCIKHPGSDHLSITTVSAGTGEPLQVVCGASNVAAGQKVALATIGTTLCFADKEITLQKTKIRGEVSEGMICAEDELGLGTSHAGILVLPADAVVGTPASEYFNIEEDVVFTIGLTPNRADAASHIGVARDLVAVINNFAGGGTVAGMRKSLEIPDLSSFSVDNNNHPVEVVIDDPEACLRYCGITISGIKAAGSPEWLKNRLMAIGLRPINNIVDITNFVLMELGQPLHAFDAGKISGNKVIVKKYPKGTKFLTLDEVERELDSDDLMICNASEPMCIGGVFGGARSGVTDDTDCVFLESALFDPRHIRRSSRRHGLQTDASFRFERGVNPEITAYALKRASLMIKEIAGGEISSAIVDVYPNPVSRRIVDLTYKNLDRLTGKTIDREVVQNILTDLGFAVLPATDERSRTDAASGFSVLVPGYKVDVFREADVIEEVLRVYGYNNIEISAEVRASLSYTSKPDPGKVQNVVSDYLAANGFHEIMNNSLTRSVYYEGHQEMHSDRCVKILNPISRDLDVMRQSLLHGGLESIVYNHNRRQTDLKLFEFGTVYSRVATDEAKDPVKGYHEEKHLSLFMTGRSVSENWNSGAAETGYFEMKGFIEGILTRLGVANLHIRPFVSEVIAEGLCYSLDGKNIIISGLLSRTMQKQFDLRHEVYYAEADWTTLFTLVPKREAKYKELPKFPEVRRDLALLMGTEVSFCQIEEVAFQAERKILKKVGLFDVYEGSKIAPDKKSYAVSFLLQDENRTLTDKDIEKVMERLVRAFSEKLNAQIR